MVFKLYTHYKRAVIISVFGLATVYTTAVAASPTTGQTQLAGATVNIYSLAADGSKILLATEITSSDGTLSGTGNFTPYTTSLDDATFYLYEVSGGSDIDSNDDGVIDATATPNQGIFHAIASGAALNSLTELKITIVSELVYQVARPQIIKDYANLQSHIDSAISSVIINDLTTDSQIDEADMFAFNTVADSDSLSVLNKANFNNHSQVVLSGKPLLLHLLNYNNVVKEIDQSNSFDMIASKDGTKVFFISGIQLGIINVADHSVSYINTADEYDNEEIALSDDPNMVYLTDDDGAFMRVNIATEVVEYFTLEDSDGNNYYELYDIKVNGAGTKAYIGTETGLVTVDLTGALTPAAVSLLPNTGLNIESLAVKADESLLYYGNADFDLIVYDLTTSTIIHTRNIDMYIGRMELSADEEIIYFANFTKGVGIFNTQTYNLIHETNGSSFVNIYDVQLNTDKTLLSVIDVSSEKSLTHYRVVDDEFITLINEELVNESGFDINVQYGLTVGEYAYLSNNNDIFIVDYNYQKPEFELTQAPAMGNTRDLIYSADQAKIYAANLSNEINVFSTIDDSLIETITIADDTYNLLFKNSLDGLLYSLDDDIYEYDFTSQLSTLKHDLAETPSTSGIKTLLELSDGRLLVAHDTRGLDIIATDGSITQITSGTARNVVVNSDETIAYVMLHDSTNGIAIVDLGDYSFTTPTLTDVYYPKAAALSSDNSRLYVGGGDVSIDGAASSYHMSIIDLANGNSVTHVEIQDQAYQISLNKAGSLVYLGSDDGIEVFDLATFERFDILAYNARNFLINADESKMYVRGESAASFFVNDISELASLDSEGDGILNINDTDDDNDGVLDTDDAFPFDVNESLDTDGDGVGNNADVDNGTNPLDAAIIPADNDGDFLSDLNDSDDDNDGVSDSSDAFPLNSAESIDTDGDGMGNNADSDDDNDGVSDNLDAFPLDYAESVDTDGDGIGNNADSDDDNDGIVDEDDSAPLDSAVGDEQAPIFAEIDSLLVEATATLTEVSLTTPEVTDNNLNAPSVISDLAGPLALGEHVITWTATDFTGNQASAEQIVTIVDTTAPVFDVIELLTVPATGRLTDILAIITITAFDLVDGDVGAELVGEPALVSGHHELELVAKDSSSNSDMTMQVVDILPQVTVSSDLTVAASGRYAVGVMLSGEAPSYPVDIDYQIIHNGAVIESLNTSLVSGVQAEMVFSVPVNVLGSDDLNLRLTSVSNAFISDSSQTKLTVIENNVAPLLAINLMQNGVSVSIVDPDNGSVSLVAAISDVNQEDSHDIIWTSADGVFSDVNDVLSYQLDPSSLAEGTYVIDVFVIENNTDELLSVSHSVQFVVENLAVLGEEIDSDGDGINDSDEGYSDSDGDGISDHLDNDGNTTRLPSMENTEPLQTSPGLVMSLGSIASAQGANSKDASLTMADLATLVGDDAADTQDNHFEALTPLYNFVIGGLNAQGDSVAVVIPLEAGTSIPEEAVYRKYNITNGWYTFVEDENNHVSSALINEYGNCPAANDGSYSAGLSQGDNCIQLLIEDGGPNDADFSINGSIEDPGAVVVEQQNHGPEINLPENYQVDEESVITLDASGTTDTEGDVLTFNWVQVSGTSVELTETTNALLTFTSQSVSEDEILTFELTVDDGIDTSTAIVEVLVYQVNKAPMITIASHVASIEENTSLTLTALATDLDGDELSYEWQQLSGPAITFSDTTASEVSITLPEVDSNTVIKVQVTVTDGDLTAISTTSIAVTNKSSSGGSMAWILLLICAVRIKKWSQIKQAA